MTFIFDTGSAWLWMPNVDCVESECPNGKYNYKLSSSYYNSNKFETQHYVQGYIKGNVCNDDFALTTDKKTQAKYVNFLSVFKAEDFNNLESDGILGLSPRTKDKGNDSGIMKHLFVQELKKDRVIDKAIFAIYLSIQDQKTYKEINRSKIHFGGWDGTIVDDSYGSSSA